MNRSVILVLLAAVVLFCAGFAYGDVYKWRDDKGNTWITDYPDPKKSEQTPGQATQPPQAPTAPQQAMEQPAPSKPGTAQPAPSVATKEGPRPGVPAPEQRRPMVMPKQAPAMPFEQEDDELGPLGFLFSGFMLIIVLAVYLFMSFCLYSIAKKLAVPYPWLAFVPIAGLWTFVASAGKPWWWIILLFVPIVSVIAFTYLWMCITENLGRDKWLGLLWLVPVVNFVFIGILAFSKYEPPSYEAESTL